MLSQFIFEKKQSHNLCCEQGVYEQVNDWIQFETEKLQFKKRDYDLLEKS